MCLPLLPCSTSSLPSALSLSHIRLAFNHAADSVNSDQINPILKKEAERFSETSMDTYSSTVPKPSRLESKRYCFLFM